MRCERWFKKKKKKKKKGELKDINDKVQGGREEMGLSLFIN